MIPRRPIKLIRVSPGSYDSDGIWSEGSEIISIIKASVQPTSPNDVEQIPEGRREQKSYTLFTDTNLIALGYHQNSDKFEIDGEIFEAVNVESWQNNIINHYKAIVVRIDSVTHGGDE